MASRTCEIERRSCSDNPQSRRATESAATTSVVASQDHAPTPPTESASCRRATVPGSSNGSGRFLIVANAAVLACAGEVNGSERGRLDRLQSHSRPHLVGPASPSLFEDGEAAVTLIMHRFACVNRAQAVLHQVERRWRETLGRADGTLGGATDEGARSSGWSPRGA